MSTPVLPRPPEFSFRRQHREAHTSTEVSSPPTSPHSRTSQSYKSIFSRNENTDDSFKINVLMKLDTIIKNQNEQLQIIKNQAIQKGALEDAEIEDVVPQPLESKEELYSLDEKLKDAAFRKNMIKYFSIIGGSTVKDTVRILLRKIGSNKLGSEFSMYGRKGKDSFKKRHMCRVIIRTCLVVHQKAKEKQIEKEIGTILKYAPHRPGGSKWKDVTTDTSTSPTHDDEEEEAF
ncbi:uncharacterized protein [Antedon mediterranea]|uniref:uncharacterized protein n=1 Tax=Antedon mediterranea TaxID=105859 RepID=UPI003AF54422